MSKEIRILIVDDHAVFIEGLRALLSDCDDMTVIGTAGTVAEAIDCAARTRPDVVLMDYRLPDGTGAIASVVIHEMAPEAHILFLSADDSEESLIAAVESGAVGYLVKTESAGSIISAIRRAHSGEILVPNSVLSRLVNNQLRQSIRIAGGHRTLQALTKRELEILALMSKGMDNDSIAQRLLLNYTTVRGHVRHVLAKLDSRSKLEAVARATDYDLLAGRGLVQTAFAARR